MPTKGQKTFLAAIITLLSVSAFSFMWMKTAVYYETEDALARGGIEEALAGTVENTTELSGNTAKKIPKKEKAVLPEQPVRIEIPALSLEADVLLVGITKSGKMGAPRTYGDVGWYKYGTVPGEKGNALMDGHVDNGLGFPAIFSRLDDLKEGDDIYVENKAGEKIHFVVTAKNTYDFDHPQSEIFTSTNDPMLHLITCAGAWQEHLNTHDKRLVVSAKRVINN